MAKSLVGFRTTNSEIIVNLRVKMFQTKEECSELSQLKFQGFAAVHSGVHGTTSSNCWLSYVAPAPGYFIPS